MNVRVRALYTYCMGGWALNRVTGVSDHLIRDSTGHSGFESSSYRCLHFLGYTAAHHLCFLCLRYTMYDNMPFDFIVAFQVFRVIRVKDRTTISSSSKEILTVHTEGWKYLKCNFDQYVGM